MVSIYIRTYKRDIAWLDFCLQSIQRNLKGWDEIVVCIPAGQEHHLRYAEGVRIVDSDLVFLPGASVDDYMEGGKPRILTCKWPNPPDVASRRWRPVVAKLFGEDPPCSFMQGHGARLFRKSSLEAFSRRFPAIDDYARRQPRNAFSEFQFLGFFIFQSERSDYAWTELSESPLPLYHARQYWSVDGLTPAVLAEMAKEGFSARWPDTLTPLDQFKRWLSQTTRRTKQWLKSIGVIRS